MREEWGEDKERALLQAQVQLQVEVEMEVEVEVQVQVLYLDSVDLSLPSRSWDGLEKGKSNHRLVSSSFVAFFSNSSNGVAYSSMGL